MIVNSLNEMCSHFNKTRNAIMYQIEKGRLPDPRNQGVELDGLEWPEGDKPGRKPGTKNVVTKFIIDDLVMRIERLEKRLASLENLSGEHG
jgi:hypothetical protein